MAEDAIDYALQGGRLPQSVKACQTHDLPLIGAIGYHSALFTEIAQNYVVPHRPGAIDTHVAQHLTRVPLFPSHCLCGALSTSLFLFLFSAFDFPAYNNPVDLGSEMHASF
jgi:hypothetical protein